MSSAASAPVKDTLAMVAHMRAALSPGTYVYTQTTWALLLPLLPQLQPHIHSITVESEGVSVLVAAACVPDPLPAAPDSPPLAHITLRVNSSLEGVGLTAAVAQRLTEKQIPCNVVAALQHDHVFVPAADAERAVAALDELAAEARGRLEGR